MGAPPSLPFFTPQQVQAVPGSKPALQQPISGTLPYRMPAIAGIAQGLSDMVDSYHAHKQAKESYYQDKFWNAVHMKMLGLGSSLDDQQIMHWAKLAGIPVKTRDAGQLQYEKDAQTYQQQMGQYAQKQAAAQEAQQGQLTNALNVASGVPGLLGSQVRQAALGAAGQPPAGLGPPPTAPTPPAPPPRPGLLGRMRNAFFGDPNQQYSTTFLQNLTQAAGGGLPEDLQMQNTMKRWKFELGKLGFDVDKLSLGNQAQIQGELKAALQGDPRYWPDLMRLRLAAPLGSDDEFIQLAPSIINSGDPDEDRRVAGRTLMFMHSGGPQRQQMMMNMYEKMLPKFIGRENLIMPWLNDMFTKGRSDIQAGLSPEENDKIYESWERVAKQYPLQTAGNIMRSILPGILGAEDPAIGLDLLSKMHKDPSGKESMTYDPQRLFSFEQGRFEQTQGLERQRVDLSRQQLLLDKDRLDADVRLRGASIQGQMYGEIQKSFGQREAYLEDILKNYDKYPSADVEAARQELRGILNKKAAVTINWNGMPMSPTNNMDIIEAQDLPGYSGFRGVIPFSGQGVGDIFRGGRRILAPTQAPPNQLGTGTTGAPAQPAAGTPGGPAGPPAAQGPQLPTRPMTTQDYTQGTVYRGAQSDPSDPNSELRNDFADGLRNLDPASRRNFVNHVHKNAMGGQGDVSDDVFNTIQDYLNSTTTQGQLGGTTQPQPQPLPQQQK